MPSLRELLASRRARILKRWTERIQREHARPGLSRLELWDDLPKILDQLGTALSAANRQSAVSLSPRERRGVGLDIEEVVREYGILADILLDELAATGSTLETGEWQLVLQCITETLAAHARQHDEELHRQTSRQVAFIAHELRNSLGTVGSAIATLRLAPTDERLHGVWIGTCGASTSSWTRCSRRTA
jgi:signal transduction histidine kinase